MKNSETSLNDILRQVISNQINQEKDHQISALSSMNQQIYQQKQDNLKAQYFKNQVTLDVNEIVDKKNQLQIQDESQSQNINTNIIQTTQGIDDQGLVSLARQKQQMESKKWEVGTVNINSKLERQQENLKIIEKQIQEINQEEQKEDFLNFLKNEQKKLEKTKIRKQNVNDEYQQLKLQRGEGRQIEESFCLPNRDERSRIGEMARFRQISGSQSPENLIKSPETQYSKVQSEMESQKILQEAKEKLVQKLQFPDNTKEKTENQKKEKIVIEQNVNKWQGTGLEEEIKNEVCKQHTPLFEKSKRAVIKDLAKNEENKKNKQFVDVSLQGAVLINENFEYQQILLGKTPSLSGFQSLQSQKNPLSNQVATHLLTSQTNSLESKSGKSSKKKKIDFIEQKTNAALKHSKELISSSRLLKNRILSLSKFFTLKQAQQLPCHIQQNKERKTRLLKANLTFEQIHSTFGGLELIHQYDQMEVQRETKKILIGKDNETQIPLVKQWFQMLSVQERVQCLSTIDSNITKTIRFMHYQLRTIHNNETGKFRMQKSNNLSLETQIINKNDSNLNSVKINGNKDQELYLQMFLVNSQAYRSTPEVQKAELELLKMVRLTDTFGYLDTLTVNEDLVKEPEKFYQLAQVIVGGNYLVAMHEIFWHDHEAELDILQYKFESQAPLWFDMSQPNSLAAWILYFFERAIQIQFASNIYGKFTDLRDRQKKEIFTTPENTFITYNNQMKPFFVNFLQENLEDQNALLIEKLQDSLEFALQLKNNEDTTSNQKNKSNQQIKPQSQQEFIDMFNGGLSFNYNQDESQKSSKKQKQEPEWLKETKNRQRIELLIKDYVEQTRLKLKKAIELKSQNQILQLNKQFDLSQLVMNSLSDASCLNVQTNSMQELLITFSQQTFCQNNIKVPEFLEFGPRQTCQQSYSQADQSIFRHLEITCDRIFATTFRKHTTEKLKTQLSSTNKNLIKKKLKKMRKKEQEKQEEQAQKSLLNEKKPIEQQKSVLNLLIEDSQEFVQNRPEKTVVEKKQEFQQIVKKKQQQKVVDSQKYFEVYPDRWQTDKQLSSNKSASTCEESKKTQQKAEITEAMSISEYLQLQGKNQNNQLAGNGIVYKTQWQRGVGYGKQQTENKYEKEILSIVNELVSEGKESEQITKEEQIIQLYVNQNNLVAHQDLLNDNDEQSIDSKNNEDIEYRHVTRSAVKQNQRKNCNLIKKLSQSPKRRNSNKSSDYDNSDDDSDQCLLPDVFSRFVPQPHDNDSSEYQGDEELEDEQDEENDQQDNQCTAQQEDHSSNNSNNFISSNMLSNKVEEIQMKKQLVDLETNTNPWVGKGKKQKKGVVISRVLKKDQKISSGKSIRSADPKMSTQVQRPSINQQQTQNQLFQKEIQQKPIENEKVIITQKKKNKKNKKKQLIDFYNQPQLQEEPNQILNAQLIQQKIIEINMIDAIRKTVIDRDSNTYELTDEQYKKIQRKKTAKIKQVQKKQKLIEEEEVKQISKIEIIKPVLEKPKIVQQKKSPAKTENDSKKKQNRLHITNPEQRLTMAEEAQILSTGSYRYEVKQKEEKPEVKEEKKSEHSKKKKNKKKNWPDPKFQQSFFPDPNFQQPWATSPQQIQDPAAQLVGQMISFLTQPQAQPQPITTSGNLSLQVQDLITKLNEQYIAQYQAQIAEVQKRQQIEQDNQILEECEPCPEIDSELYDYFFDNLEQEMKAEIKNIDLLKDSVRKEREGLISIIEAKVKETFSHKQGNGYVGIKIFGSMATQLAIETSDIDLVVTGIKTVQPGAGGYQTRITGGVNNYMYQHSSSREHLLKVMDKLYESLQQLKIFGHIQKMKFIKNANVPIIKLKADLQAIAQHQAQKALEKARLKKEQEIYEKYGTVSSQHLEQINQMTMKDFQIEVQKIMPKMRYVKVDISIDENSDDKYDRSHQGIVTIYHIQDLIKQRKDLRPIVMIIKKIFDDTALSIPYLGGISSFSLVLMVSAYLKRFDTNMEESLSRNLSGFFHFYGVIFKPNLFYLNGDKIEFCQNENDRPLTDQLIVLDPLAPQNNVGHATFRFRDIQRALIQAFKIINESCEKYQKVQDTIEKSRFQPKKVLERLLREIKERYELDNFDSDF